MRNPWWLTVLTVLASISLAGWFLVSFASSLGVSCSSDACQQRADTGWLVLMAAQLVVVALTIVALARRGWRPWGIALGLVVPAATFFVITRIFYPPGFSL